MSPKQIRPEELDDLGSLLSQKHLSATALPTHMIRIVNVAGQAGFFESDNVSVFICTHIAANVNA